MCSSGQDAWEMSVAVQEDYQSEEVLRAEDITIKKPLDFKAKVGKE